MAFLIRTIAVAKSGREIVRDRTVDKSDLVIGRAPESDIHLPDLTVELQHVSLAEVAGGQIEVRSLGQLPFNLDGSSVTSGRINPNSGAEIEVGPARLEVSREGTGSVQIIISQIKKAKAESEPTEGFALGSALPSKRAMAWIFSVAIFVLLLSVPIITYALRTPVENDPDNLKQGQVLLDSAWSTGELSMKHHDLEENCEACHQTAFVSVQDETCLSCHEDVGEHAAMADLRKGMPPLSQGDAIQWSIAETLGKEGPLGCVSCHTEHEGQVKLEAADQQFCSDCHSDLDTRITDVKFSNASDFGEKHPQFRPQFYTAHFADNPVRVSLDRKPKPVEESGLKFTHDEHVDENGGVARMAISIARYNGKPLDCDSCHVKLTDADRTKLRKGSMSDTQIAALGDFDFSEIELASLRGGGLSESSIRAMGDFKPVVMEDACESCHSLVLDQVGGQFRSLDHGNVEKLMADLASLNRGPRQPVVTGRERPGQFGRGGRYNANFGRPMSAYIAINRAFDSKGVCGECHIPTTTNGRRDLVPVNLPQRFLTRGYFDHIAHDKDANGKVIAECSDCHKASESKAATDLLIPDVESCQECHKGEAAVKTEEITPSSCAMCHGYHTPTMPWKPEDHPDLPGNGGNDSVAAILSSLRR